MKIDKDTSIATIKELLLEQGENPDELFSYQKIETLLRMKNNLKITMSEIDKKIDENLDSLSLLRKNS